MIVSSVKPLQEFPNKRLFMKKVSLTVWICVKSKHDKIVCKRSIQRDHFTCLILIVWLNTCRQRFGAGTGDFWPPTVVQLLKTAPKNDMEASWLVAVVELRWFPLFTIFYCFSGTWALADEKSTSSFVVPRSCRWTLDFYVLTNEICWGGSHFRASAL